jgi:hypothetical protein
MFSRPTTFASSSGFCRTNTLHPYCNMPCRMQHPTYTMLPTAFCNSCSHGARAARDLNPNLLLLRRNERYA